MKQVHDKCPKCGGRNFHYQASSTREETNEKDFGKTAVVCANKSACGEVIEYIKI